MGQWNEAAKVSNVAEFSITSDRGVQPWLLELIFVLQLLHHIVGDPQAFQQIQ